MSSLKNVVSSALVAVSLTAGSVLFAYAAGTDGTIYDPKILDRISFTSQQLPAVKAILDKSEEGVVRVFTKFRIDPRAKPNFDLLRAASTELQAIEAWEKSQMKKVLSKDQYADYLEIQQATTAAVIKATRDD